MTNHMIKKRRFYLHTQDNNFPVVVAKLRDCIMTARYVATHGGGLWFRGLLYCIQNYNEAIQRPECKVALYKTDTKTFTHTARSSNTQTAWYVNNII
jgi:hypothetical protein